MKIYNADTVDHYRPGRAMETLAESAAKSRSRLPKYDICDSPNISAEVRSIRSLLSLQ